MPENFITWYMTFIGLIYACYGGLLGCCVNFGIIYFKNINNFRKCRMYIMCSLLTMFISVNIAYLFILDAQETLFIYKTEKTLDQNKNLFNSITKP